VAAAILAVFFAYLSDKAGRRSPFVIVFMLISAAMFAV
jgi:MFS family permease